MKKLFKGMILLLAVSLIIPSGCKKEEPSQAEIQVQELNDLTSARGAHTRTFNADVAVAWMKMQLRIMTTATGIPNVAFCRPYAYSGIALYEAVKPGMPAYRSLVGQLNGLPAMPHVVSSLEYYWPGSANAALASIIKKMYPTTSPANVTSIDSLETALNTYYSGRTDSATLNRSVSFGRAVAQIVFDWAETDGYLGASAAYTAPIGPGLWVPTPPGFAAASTPYWGNVRLMITGSDFHAQPGPPTSYSEIPNSTFYNQAKEVYDASQAITPAQTAMALYWRDIPGVTTPGHYLSILKQVLESEHPGLDKASMAWALSSITVFDAAVSCWKTKYNFNLVRPVTYIRTVLGHPTWSPLLTTPAHPEYSSAHAVLSAANAEVLRDLFGCSGGFTDHTYDYLGYAPRAFSSFRALAEDAGNSRLYAGIHYQNSINVGMVQGRKIAENIEHRLRLRRD